MVVVLVEDLGSDVIRGAELLIKVTVWVVDKGGTEVNDLDLVEFFVLLKQDVFWLQVTVNNVGLMAVIYAGQDLFHQNSSIALTELATL